VTVLTPIIIPEGFPPKIPLN